MSSCKSITVSSQPAKQKEFARKCNSIRSSAVDPVKAKLTKNKESTCDGKREVLRKKIPPFSKRTTVQIIDSSKVMKGHKIPAVKIKDETTCVNVLERIKCASGLPFIEPPLPNLKSDAITVQTFSFESKLNQPQFQSSVVLMKDLEKLKTLEIETQSLLLKAKKDVKWKKSLISKVFP